MDDLNIIKIVEELGYPYLKFNVKDIFEDRKNYDSPETLDTLFFKIISINNKIISKKLSQQFLDKIKDLNIGNVEEVFIPYFGSYILIHLYEQDYLLK